MQRPAAAAPDAMQCDVMQAATCNGSGSGSLVPVFMLLHLRVQVCTQTAPSGAWAAGQGQLHPLPCLLAASRPNAPACWPLTFSPPPSTPHRQCTRHAASHHMGLQCTGGHQLLGGGQHATSQVSLTPQAHRRPPQQSPLQPPSPPQPHLCSTHRQAACGPQHQQRQQHCLCQPPSHAPSARHGARG